MRADLLAPSEGRPTTIPDLGRAARCGSAGEDGVAATVAADATARGDCALACGHFGSSTTSACARRPRGPRSGRAPAFGSSSSTDAEAALARRLVKGQHPQLVVDDAVVDGAITDHPSRRPGGWRWGGLTGCPLSGTVTALADVSALTAQASRVAPVPRRRGAPARQGSELSLSPASRRRPTSTLGVPRPSWCDPVPSGVAPLRGADSRPPPRLGCRQDRLCETGPGTGPGTGPASL